MKFNLAKIKTGLSKRTFKDILIERVIVDFLVEEAERVEPLLTNLENLTCENHALKAQLSLYNPMAQELLNEIVRSKKHENKIIPYLIIKVIGNEAECINLLDRYKYTVPLDDLYIWVENEDRTSNYLKDEWFLDD